MRGTPAGRDSAQGNPPRGRRVRRERGSGARVIQPELCARGPHPSGDPIRLCPRHMLYWVPSPSPCSLLTGPPLCLWVGDLPWGPEGQLYTRGTWDPPARRQVVLARAPTWGRQDKPFWGSPGTVRPAWLEPGQQAQPRPPTAPHGALLLRACSRARSSRSASFRARGPALGRRWGRRWGPRWPLWACSRPSGVCRQTAPSAGFSRCPDTPLLYRRRQTKKQRGPCKLRGAQHQVPTSSQGCGSAAAGLRVWGRAGPDRAAGLPQHRAGAGI
ncbi:unnamed protein product, partial [Gulo gulo]